MAKPFIVKRNTKGSALTFTELDANFQNLDDATISIAVQGGDTVINDLNDTTTFIESDGIEITASPSSQSISFDASLVKDTTPQLGGNLDVNGHSIVSVSNGNITLAPNGTGKVIVSGDLQVDGTTTTINSTTLDVDDKNITLAKGAANSAAADGGGITLEGPATAATLLYEADDDSWNVNKKFTAPELQVDNVNVNGNAITSTNVDGDIQLTPNGDGQVVIDGLNWPIADGSDRSVLTTDGAGNLEFEPVDNLRAFVHNAESVQINKGQPVYAYSSSGSHISVKLALNTGDSTSAQTLGLAAANISAGGQGYIICQGLLKNINTTAYASGDALYLGATAGSVTTTKPSAPNHLVYLGFVEVGGSAAGRIYVRTQNGYELDEIHDVDINSPQDGDLIQYVGSSDLWTNVPATSIGATYSISAETTTGGAHLRLTGSNATTDNVKFANGTGITLTRTDADTITVATTVVDTNTTYTLSAESTSAADCFISLNGSDATADLVRLNSGTGITVEKTDANTITISRQVYTWDSLSALTWDDLG